MSCAGPRRAGEVVARRGGTSGGLSSSPPPRAAPTVGRGPRAGASLALSAHGAGVSPPRPPRIGALNGPPSGRAGSTRDRRGGSRRASCLSCGPRWTGGHDEHRSGPGHRLEGRRRPDHGPRSEDPLKEKSVTNRRLPAWPSSPVIASPPRSAATGHGRHRRTEGHPHVLAGVQTLRSRSAPAAWGWPVLTPAPRAPDRQLPDEA